MGRLRGNDGQRRHRILSHTNELDCHRLIGYIGDCRQNDKCPPNLPRRSSALAPIASGQFLMECRIHAPIPYPNSDTRGPSIW